MGYSVAISGKTLLTGADGARAAQGVAYVFTEPPGGWQTAPGGLGISASDGAPNNEFGAAVAIGGRPGGVCARLAEWY